MALSAGTRLGSYEVLAPLGAGGMGEVYCARDTRLGREVALKILPDEFASDQQRLTRFDREAQMLAALNHPNIAAIHGIEQCDGRQFLVLELVPGETLGARITRGRVPLDETLVICRQIAEALEAAHEKGIIHRDLKPANVKVTPDGNVKVLDFGLAKIVEPEAPLDPFESPTISVAATRAGMILGTAAYMSPEQARGGTVDKRTDVWSFGCLMYELLTGKRAFVGATVSDTLASLLKMEPEWNELPAEVPPSIQRLLRRCLQKQPRERLRDIGDARLEIEEALKPAPPLQHARVASASGIWRWVAIALAVTIAVLLWWWRPWGVRTTATPVTKFAIALPPNETLAGLARPAVAFSPDGSKLAYVASRSGVSQIYVRSMQQAEAMVLPGTEGASGPFFSPDGQWLGFLVSRSLKKVSLLGGPPQEIAKVPPIGCGADWAPDGSVILSLAFGNAGLHRLPAAGGEPQALTKLDSKSGERSHCWPQVLPSGNEVLFTIVTSADPNEWRIALLRLKTGKWETLLPGASMARYSHSGHLAYVRGGSLMVAPFDVRQLKLTGSGVPVIENVLAWGNRASQFSISTAGSLAYVTGNLTPTERTLVWVTRQGHVQPVLEQRRAYDTPRLSQDGQRVMLQIGEPNEDIWQLELGRGVLTRITTEDTREGFPVWCGGQRVVFASDRNRRPQDLFWKAADGSGSTQALLQITDKPYPQFPFDCTADGMLIFAEDHVLSPVEGLATTGWDIVMIPVSGERKTIPLVQTPFDEFDAQVSPDGRWLAYVSNASGKFEVYIQAFPGGGQKLQVSAEGGSQPRWSRNGRELFYRTRDKMMAVQISNSPPSPLRVSRPQMLFEGYFLGGASNPGNASYDVAADGRFVMIRSDKEAGPTQINIVLNWFEELKSQTTRPR